MSELIKERECIRCEKFFECKGKPRGNGPCLNLVERKKENGKQKNV